jgi:hypothetical protein
MWYWHKSRSGEETSLGVTDLRVPAIAIFAAVASLISLTYGHGHTVSDESSYLFQARIFASGQLKAEPMPGATALPGQAPSEIKFEQQLQYANGWFSKYPPGWPLLLAVGYLTGCPWLVNPVLGVVLLLLVNRLARPWGRSTQILAVTLTAYSAYTLIYSVGFLSHASAALFAMAALAALFTGVQRERFRWIGLGFLLVLADTEIRPYTGAVIAVLCAGYTLVALLHNRRLLWPALAVIFVTACASGGLMLFVNRLFTGYFFLSPYAWFHNSTTIHELTLNPSLIARNIVSMYRWSVTDTITFTFPFVFVAAAYACAKERYMRRELICLALLFPMLVIAYTLQTYQATGSIDGERYYYEGYAALCVVAARGFLLLTEGRQVRRRAARLGLAGLAAIHTVFIVIMLHDVESSLEPWRVAWKASIAAPVPPMVFLSGFSGSKLGLASKHANWNDARWKSSPTLFLNDPGAGQRTEVACRFHRPFFRVVVVNGKTLQVNSRDFRASCQ